MVFLNLFERRRKMNNGQQFEEAVCNRLRSKNVLLLDANILGEIRRMRWDEIKEMCAAENSGTQPTSTNKPMPKLPELKEVKAVVRSGFVTIREENIFQSGLERCWDFIDRQLSA
jgi:hypothetical protein